MNVVLTDAVCEFDAVYLLTTITCQ